MKQLLSQRARHSIMSAQLDVVVAAEKLHLACSKLFRALRTKFCVDLKQVPNHHQPGSFGIHQGFYSSAEGCPSQDW